MNQFPQQLPTPQPQLPPVVYCPAYTPQFFSNKAVVIEGTVLLLLLILFIGLVAFFIYRWYCRQTATLQDRTYEQLRAIQRRPLETKHELKLAYYDLTRLVKWYVEEIFLIPIVSLTDDEAIQSMEKHTLDEQIIKDCKTVFTTALGIKYARYETAKESLHNDIKVIEHLIKKTTPVKKNNK